MEHKLPQANYLKFMTAGHGIFTVRNAKTGNRFTYRIGIPGDKKPEEATLWFVSGFTGSDNNNDYKYFGFTP